MLHRAVTREDAEDDIIQEQNLGRNSIIKTENGASI
jgi:hypothetical protein